MKKKTKKNTRKLRVTKISATVKNGTSLIQAKGFLWFLEVGVLSLTISFIPDLVVGGYSEAFLFCPYDVYKCARIAEAGELKLLAALMFAMLFLVLTCVIIFINIRTLNRR